MADVDTSEHAGPGPAADPFLRADQSCAFGPSFFLHHLGRFVRDHCPDPSEHLPVVEVRLADGIALNVCHIVGVSPRWVLLAVRDAASPHEHMTIEFVPYELIRRIEIGTSRSESPTIGFAQHHAPEVIAAEALLEGAQALPAAGASNV